MLLSPLKGLSVATGRETPSGYLKQQRDLYPNPSYGAFEFVGGLGLTPRDRILLIGESRGFYSPVFAIASAPYDVPVVNSWANGVDNADELYEKLKSEKVAAVVLNPNEYVRNNYKRNADPKKLLIIQELFDRHLEKIYEDAWSQVYRLKSAD
jgi:hypothetical protein